MLTKLMTIPQLAKQLGVSRNAVYKRVKNGNIRAERVGRNYLIRRQDAAHLVPHQLTSTDKRRIDAAVGVVVDQYGKALEWLGRE